MNPNPFETVEQRHKNHRMGDTIYAELNVGGKFFCWHDWTYFAPAIRNHLLDWGFLYKCTKCGKSRVFKEMQIEPVPPPQS